MESKNGDGLNERDLSLQRLKSILDDKLNEGNERGVLVVWVRLLAPGLHLRKETVDQFLSAYEMENGWIRGVKIEKHTPQFYQNHTFQLHIENR